MYVTSSSSLNSNLGQKRTIITNYINSILQSKSYKSEKYQPIQPQITRTQVYKKAFIYLHKYFLYKDITQLKLTKSQAQQYCQKLHFQRYLPSKLGLPLQLTRTYDQWFQILFQYTDNRDRSVSQAAMKLYELIDQQGSRMLIAVRGFQLCHLKRLLYIASLKLLFTQSRERRYIPAYSLIQNQLSSFIDQNRPYQTTLRQFSKLIQHYKQSNQILDQTFLMKQLIKNQQIQLYSPEMIPFFISLFKNLTEQRNSPIEQSSMLVKKLKALNIITNQSFVHNLQLIKGNTQLNQKFVQFVLTQNNC